MKYVLVIQFSSALVQLDELVDLESQLICDLGSAADVDGHDYGSGEMNIFIYTEHPQLAFAMAKSALEGKHLMHKLKAAYRPFDENDYTLLWPENCTSSFSVK